MLGESKSPQMKNPRRPKTAAIQEALQHVRDHSEPFLL
jgi:hypothetical protein